LESRHVGDVTVVTCRGRLVAGPESSALQAHLDALIAISPQIIIHLGDVDFIDSGGLGLLVRCRQRAQNAGGNLKVCAVSPKINDVLRITHLDGIFQAYETEAEAIADAHRTASGVDVASLDPNVLCVDQSPDVLAYLRELLKQAGHRVITAGNLPDALILFTATNPKVVVISAALRAARGTRAAEEFARLADKGSVVELPPGFSSQDAGDAAQQVLQAVRASVDLPRAPTTSTTGT
jgi:anti-anti-sigma factor